MKKLFTGIILSLSVSGCATIFTGTGDRITFNSKPEGAKILVNGIERGKTPSTIRVKRKLGDTYVTLKKNGFSDKTIVLEKEFNAVSIFNLWNILAWAIDGVSGSVMKYSIKSYDSELEQRVAYKLNDLNITEDGKYLIPKFDKEVILIDEEYQLAFVVSH